MKRAFLTAVLLCLVGLSGPSVALVSDNRSLPISIDASGNLLYTHTTPPPGLVDPLVAIGEDGTLSVTNFTPPPGLVDPTVTIGQDGTLTATSVPAPPGLVNPVVAMDEGGVLSVTHVTPPGGLANPRVTIGEGGDLLESFKPPALSVTGALVLIALMLILGGYALARHRTAQLP